MALFGDLEHHALTDLAKVLRPQTGTLFFHEAYQGRTLELTLMQGQLRALYVDGFSVPEPTQVREILRELHTQDRGAFEFQRRDFPVTTPSFYDLPLGELLQTFAAAFIPPDQLPHPETRFVPVAAALPVPASLAEVWTLLRPHLTTGASALELAVRVGRPERDVLVMLHHLRAVDLIVPFRAASPQAVPPAALAVVAPTMDGFAPPAKPPAPAPAPLVQRLLGALRRLGGAVRT